MSKPEGPYLVVACFCGAVQKDEEGVISIERIVDTFSAPRAQAGETMSFQTTLFLHFRAGAYPRPLTIEIIPRRADGVTLETNRFHLEFSAPYSHATLTGPYTMQGMTEGKYFYDVLVDGKFETRMPVRISFT